MYYIMKFKFQENLFLALLPSLHLWIFIIYISMFIKNNDCKAINEIKSNLLKKNHIFWNL